MKKNPYLREIIFLFLSIVAIVVGLVMRGQDFAYLIITFAGGIVFLASIFLCMSKSKMLAIQKKKQLELEQLAREKAVREAKKVKIEEEKSKPKTCKYCGCTLKPNAENCHRCGAPIK